MDREALLQERLARIDALVACLEGQLGAGPVAGASALEDIALRHLAKATGTARAALGLVRDQCWTDACILTRAVFEQLFAFLWIVQDAARVEVRIAMVTLKQEWANAKYLEGLAARAATEHQALLLEESRAYKERADALLGRLAAELGTTEKKVRDEATLRVSAKALEVNLDPAFSLPYAYYSGFVHTDGNALAAYGRATPAGTHYDTRGAAPAHLPLASDLHRVLLRLAREVAGRCPRPGWQALESTLAAEADWLAAADARGRALGEAALE